MNPCLHVNSRFRPCNVPHHSTKIHTAKVKLGNAKNSLNIDINNNSLSSFTLSPAPARARVYTRARVSKGESWETRPGSRSLVWAPSSRTFAPCGVLRPGLGKDATVASRPTRANVAYSRAIPPVVGTSRQSGQARGRGNSSRPSYSFFCLSDFF